MASIISLRPCKNSLIYGTRKASGLKETSELGETINRSSSHEKFEGDYKEDYHPLPDDFYREITKDDIDYEIINPETFESEFVQSLIEDNERMKDNEGMQYYYASSLEGDVFIENDESEQNKDCEISIANRWLNS